jgi:type IV secretory pathway VirB2 component (pilin)
LTQRRAVTKRDGIAQFGTNDVLASARSPIEEATMSSRVSLRVALTRRSLVPLFTVFIIAIAFATPAFAQSPWERAASNLAATFTGPLARSLALVAIVIGGLMFMFGEGGAKRQISGIVFGGGLALFAGQFLAWLF